MGIKESSDELNPVVVTAQAPVRAKPIRYVKDYLALAIATCGVGYMPIAPGTFGSLVGLGIYFILQSVVFDNMLPGATHFSRWPMFLAIQLTAITLITLVGIWAATRTEKLAGRKDPGKVVVDEVAGQLIALLPISYAVGASWIPISAFFLFRLFDIIKPYPARRLESLESGLGIMADDVVAGAYAAVVVSLIVLVRTFN